MVSRRSYSLIELFSAWLFLLWLNSLITSDTAARRFQVSSPAASFTRKTHRSSPATMEMVRSVNAAPPITTAGSAQSECKLTGSTRLSTATNHPLPWFSISHPVRVKPERDDLPPQHFASYSDERPEAELHCLTTAPSPTSLCSSAAVSELDPNRSLDVSFHCVVMDLRPSSGLDESYGSRYGNIGVLFLSWISVYAPLWIIVKRIVSPLRRLYYTPDIAAAPSHQGFYGAKLHWLNLCLQVTAGPIVQECWFARVAHDYVTAASLSHYAVSSIDGSSQSRSSFPNLLVAGTIVQECGLARITNYIMRVHHITPSLSVTNYWARHGNVEFRGLEPLISTSMSSNFILSASLEVGLRTVNVAYGSRASHLKFLPLNIPTTYRCINVVFDYQLFFRTIVMGTKVEFSFGFLHFAEHDSPLDGSIFSCFVLFSNFILPSSVFPRSSGSVVNFDAFAL
ncbi:hypothetical protein HID58_061067 [Brassica napus]|uniref:Membrane-associated protein n=1 Tax=Brassica napus TaxID=3708 RepID=A0ABQ7ZXI9_BRANA|nr:hypothetical protein HID58_061067 [Brassica napus]